LRDDFSYRGADVTAENGIGWVKSVVVWVVEVVFIKTKREHG